MALGDTAGILFKIRADGSQAESELKKVTGAVSGAGSGLSALAGPAAIAAAGIAAVGAIAVTAASALFGLTKSSADFGSAIFDAREKTGLAATTLSSLQVAAEQSGASLESVTGGLARFAKTIGEAGNGSDQAQEKLKRLGVTSKDLDTALGQALKTIAGYPPGVQQMTAAQDAFGKSGADLLPFIKSFDGDLPALIKKCKELGLTLSDEDAAAADMFGDSLDQLGQQAKVAGFALTKDLMPVLAKMFNDLGRWYSQNQNEIRAWGRTIATVVSATITSFKLLIQYIKDNWNYLRVGLALATGGASELIGGIVSRIELPQTPARPEAQESYGGSGVIDAVPDSSTTGKGTAKGPNVVKVGRADDQKAGRSAAVQYAEREMAATLAIYKAGYAQRLALLDQQLLNEGRKLSEHVRDVGKVKLDELEDEKRLNQELLKNANLTADDRKDILRKIEILDKQIATQRIENSNDVVKAVKAETEAENGKTEELKRQRKAIEDAAKAEQERSDEAYRDFLDREAREEERKAKRYEQQQVGILGESVLTGIDAAGERVNNFSNIWQTLKETAGNALQSMASGIGNLVQNMVLLGAAGPKAFQKLVASVLAGVAAQAAVLAVMELAYGVAALTPWGFAIYGSPFQHFKAAALFGGIALGAGLAGRGVAGDSFKQQTGAATSIPGGGSSAGANRNVDAQGRPYSGQPDQVLGNSRNAPADRRMTLVLKIESNDSHIVKAIKEDFERNGIIRDLVLA